jgi:hypothetical protein
MSSWDFALDKLTVSFPMKSRRLLSHELAFYESLIRAGYANVQSDSLDKCVMITRQD